MVIRHKTPDPAIVLLRIMFFAFLVVLAASTGFVLLRRQAKAERGAVFGVPDAVNAPGMLRGLGVNVDLTRLAGQSASPDSPYSIDDALEDIKRSGLGWVRQPFPWSEIEPEKGQFVWDPWDRVVTACERHGIDLVAVLYTSPPWARSPANSDEPFAPPESLADFGEFAVGLASRYGSSLDYYQIWDSPNIQPNWGDALIDPTGYMRLLREGSVQIRAVDPTAVVVLAGLAPTTESGPVNMSEPLFLDELYGAGAAPFFDVVAAKPYGFWSGPDDRRTAHSVLNFSRLTLCREVMVANRDAQTPVWAVEMGWNALPTDWSGAASPWGTDGEVLQAERTLEAIRRARIEWPWLTAIGLAQLLPPDNPDDPRAGFAVLDREQQPRQLYQALVTMAGEDEVAYPGHHSAADPAFNYGDGQWRVRAQATDVGEQGDVATLEFYGTRVDLKVRRGRFWGLLYVSVDGQAANGLPEDGEGRSYLVLHDPLEREATVTLASGLEEQPHHLELRAHGGWEQWPLLGFTVVRERGPWTGGLFLVVCLVLGIAGVTGAVYNALFLPWESWWPAVLAWFTSLGDGVHLALLALLGGVFVFSPNVWLSTVCLACLWLLICLRPVLGLVLVTFSIPFFLEVKHLPGHSFGLLELALILAAAGSLVHFGLQGLSSLKQSSGKKDGGATSGSGAALSLSSLRSLRFDEAAQLDLTMILLVVVGVVSVLTAQNFGVANRELRVVIVEPVVFYFMIRFVLARRRDVWLLTDVLVLTAVVVAFIGLYQYVGTSDVITAEGVRRIKGVYASPNNLSLFLGRIASLLAALLLTLPLSRRRVLYGLAALPVFVCLYLTYSRGAWLVGLPVAILFIVLIRKGRTLWVGLVALGVLLLSLIPLIWTDRLSRLWSSQDGTAFFRVRLWQGTIRMIRDHPVFGVGLDNFLYQYRTRYVLPDAWREPNLSHPHNIFLDCWTRLGIMGLVVVFWQQLSFFKLGLKTYRGLMRGAERGLVLALLTSMVYSLAHGLIDNSFFLVDLAFVLTLTIGLTVRLSFEWR